MCAGIEGGAEAAIHAIRDTFEQEECEGVLLIDADNAFNRLNRKAALHNIRVRCPRLSQFLLNLYRIPIRLFVGGTEILSYEGTTQGDPLGSAMYAIATAPLILALSGQGTASLRGPPEALELPTASCLDDDRGRAFAIQVWFADDGTIAGRLRRLRAMWDLLCRVGPDLGYFPSGTKTHLVVKPGLAGVAETIFQGTKVIITEEGKRHLGAAIGTSDFLGEYVRGKSLEWVRQMELLSEAALWSPHAAHAGYTKGFQGRWNFILRTIPNAWTHLEQLHKEVEESLSPALTQKECFLDPDLMQALRLACRYGGLGLVGPMTHRGREYEDSRKVTQPLVNSIRGQHLELHPQVRTEMKEIRSQLRTEKEKRKKKAYEDFMLSSAPETLRRAVQTMAEDGVSAWLTVLPLVEQGFYHAALDWKDVIAARYGLPMKGLPSHCGCGKSFTLSHALQCATGGFIIARHNDIRDFLLDLLGGLFADVRKEPSLDELSEEEQAELRARYKTANLCRHPRGDLSAMGFWRPHQRVYGDVRVWNHMATTYSSMTSREGHLMHERMKRHEYEQRIKEYENADFVPLVFSTAGGCGPAARAFIARLAKKIEET